MSCTIAYTKLNLLSESERGGALEEGSTGVDVQGQKPAPPRNSGRAGIPVQTSSQEKADFQNPRWRPTEA